MMIHQLVAESLMRLFHLVVLLIWTPLLALMENDPAEQKKRDEAGKVNFLGKKDLLKLVIDNLFQLKDRLPNYEASAWLAKKFGSVLYIRVPTCKEVYINLTNLELSKEIMSSSCWLNRLYDDHYLHSTTFNKPLGLLFGSGDDYRESKRVTLKLLHQLDFFKMKKMESWISFEMAEMIIRLQDRVNLSGGELLFSPHQLFELATLNVVCQVLMGTRFQADDPIAKKIMDETNRANREFSAVYTVLELFRWLKYLPSFSFLGSFQNCSTVIYNFFRAIIEERRKSGAYSDHQNNFLDAFLLEIERRAGECPNYINDEALLVCLRDMILAGMDTTNSALEHGILHMALNPEIQKKVQSEIDEIIGHSNQPMYEDRTSMVYTQAVLLETLRVASPVPGTSRAALQDTKLRGEHVPRGSMAVVNIYAIHRNEDMWEDPDSFRPERFLSSKGELINANKIIPFGFGKRICIGETIARCTLFIFFVSMFQKFSVEISDKHGTPSLKNVLGLSRCPIPYHIKLRNRHTVAS